MVAASVAGAAHEKTGQSCQDAVLSHQTSEGILLAALADGAGSAVLGEVGATLAVQSALESLRHNVLAGDPETSLHLALTAARLRLEQESEQREITLRDLATTLILLIASPETIAVAQVGDGATVMRDSAGRLQTLTAPPDTDYINETLFLTAPDALESAQVVLRPEPVLALAAFTDGLQRLALKFPEGEPHAPFFNPLFQFLLQAENISEAEARMAALLRSPRITERTEDDLTLMLAVFLPE